jgi:hypothetical protein
MKLRANLWSLSICAVAFLVLGPPGKASAGMIYEVTVDTSSFAGTMGSLEFQLNPVAGAGYVQGVISGFSSNGGVLGSVDPPNIGDASGDLGSQVTLDNGTGFNDLLQDFTYGSSFTFLVTFTGAGTSLPSADTEFSMTLWNQQGGSGNALFSIGGVPGGTALTIDMPDNTVVTGNPAVVANPVPEPATLVSALSGLAALLMYGLESRRRRSQRAAQPA